MVTDEQDQANQVEMAIRGEDVCRYCGRVMPVESLAVQPSDTLGRDVVMCLRDFIDACLAARDEHDQRRAG